MARLIFVHGTGVRDAAYAKTLRAVQRGLVSVGLPHDVERCLWGDPKGARLWAGGASIPDYAGDADLGDGLDLGNEFALWWLLDQDPYYELRRLAEREEPRLQLAPGKRAPGQVLADQVRVFAPSTELKSMLAAHALGPHFDAALTELRAADAWLRATQTCAAGGVEHAQAFARALVARTMKLGQHDGAPTLARDAREELLDELDRLLGADVKGLFDSLKNVAAGFATRWISGKRDVMSASSPVAGDVLYYQAKGRAIRDFIREQVEASGDEVVLLAHSLGGIASFELLVEHDLPAVTHLITVGSQAPLLYELNALATLDYGADWPAHFGARWLNIYDPHDFLSFEAQPLFPGRARDMRVSNGQPFPASHSAYWTNAKVWDAIKAALA